MINFHTIKYLYTGTKDAEKSIDQMRSENILISFLFSTKIIILLFIILNLLGNRPYAAIADSIFFIVLLFIGLFFNRTGKVQLSYFLFIFFLLLLVSMQHLIASTNLYSNIIWLPIFIFVSHSFLKQRFHWPITIVGITVFELATLKHYFFPSILLEASSDLEALITNFVTILIAGVATFIASRTTLGQDLAIKKNLEEQKNNFQQLNYNNAALSSMITHDIASPLTVALAYTKKLSPSQEKDKIEASLQKIADIIANARQLRAMKAGKLKITLHSVNISTVLAEIVNNFQAQALKKNISIILHLPSDNIYVQAEKNSLYTSVLNNLILNAIKFSKNNSKIDIVLSTDKNNVIVKVQDYGIGIPSKLQKKLFDFTAQTTRKGTSGEVGTGFGLPLVKLFCDIYNCSIQIDSTTTPGKSGTSFILTFKKGHPDDSAIS